jgi:hypothetical protein
MGPTRAPRCVQMRLMFVIWVSLIVAGIVFFTVVGLLHR